jgi:hypothetical protein
MTLLAGCATPPWLKDVWNQPDYEDAGFTRDEQVRLGYLARYLADTNTRVKLESEVLQTEYVRQWTAVDYSTMTSMGTDLVEGQIASDLGAELGAAVLVLGLLSGDGSMDYISQAFLPAQVNGRVIGSAAEAQMAAHALIQDRLEAVAAGFGSRLQCVRGCDTPDSVYVLRLPSERPHEQFVYWPADIVITVNVGAAEAVADADPVSSLLGFPVAWKTLPGNSARIRLYSEGTYDAGGQLQFEPAPAGQMPEPVVRYRLESTALGRTILTRICSDRQLLWGTQRSAPGMVFFEGDIYGFIGNGRPDFINKRVALPVMAGSGSSL